MVTFRPARSAIAAVLDRCAHRPLGSGGVWSALALLLVTGCSHGSEPHHPGTLSWEQAEELAVQIEAGDAPTLVAAELPDGYSGMLGKVAGDNAKAFAEIAHDFNASSERVRTRGKRSNMAAATDLSGIWESPDGLQYTIAKIPRGYSIVEEGTLVARMPPLEMAAGAGTFDGSTFKFRYNTLAGTSGWCALKANRGTLSLTGAFQDRQTGRQQQTVLKRL